MKILKQIYNYLTTRYTKVQLLIILVVITFAFLISDSSIFSRISYDAKIMELNDQIEFYQDQKAKDQKKLNEIQDDKEHVEKMARENYLMKKPNEDVFIIK